MTQRILIECPSYETADQVAAIKKAFSRVLGGRKGESDILETVLFLPTHGDAQNEIFTEIFGRERARALSRGSKERLQGCRLRVGTPNSLRDLHYVQAVIAALVTERQLDVLDQIQGAGVIVVVPWTADAGSRWKVKWPDAETVPARRPG